MRDGRVPRRDLSWRWFPGVLEKEWEELMRLEKLVYVLHSLDRCEHGRHQGDICVSCPLGQCAGNPFIMAGQVIGYDHYGNYICLPERHHKTDPDRWIRRRGGGDG